MRCNKCNTKGKAVEIDTVLNLCNDYVKNTIIDDKYYICINPECEVAYYSVTGREIEQDCLNTSINFKNKKNKNIVCYCRDIDLDDVYLAVNKTNDYSILKITHLLLKDDVALNCLQHNPTGKDCTKEFIEAIEVAKKIKNMKGKNND